MLDRLREILGDNKFFQACREFFQTYKAASATTADFRSFWDKTLGAQRNTLDAWLDSKGALPAS